MLPATEDHRNRDGREEQLELEVPHRVADGRWGNETQSCLRKLVVAGLMKANAEPGPLNTIETPVNRSRKLQATQVERVPFSSL